MYPNRKEITSGDELKEAVKFDHVCGEFRKNYRSINNFLKSNVIVMDCDNDHSEDPEDWITFKKMEELFAALRDSGQSTCSPVLPGFRSRSTTRRPSSRSPSVYRG